LLGSFGIEEPLYTVSYDEKLSEFDIFIADASECTKEEMSNGDG